jgi:hypothetical protein
MRSLLGFITVLAAAVSAVRCGDSTPTTAGPTPGTVTVSVVGTLGNGSYVPNPVQTNGNQVMFRNDDTAATHHIVMDDGSADFGNLAPGTAGPARSVAGGNFHCTNHPSMVGSINGATAPTPAPGSGNGY